MILAFSEASITKLTVKTYSRRMNRKFWMPIGAIISLATSYFSLSIQIDNLLRIYCRVAHICHTLCDSLESHLETTEYSNCSEQQSGNSCWYWRQSLLYIILFMLSSHHLPFTIKATLNYIQKCINSNTFGHLIQPIYYVSPFYLSPSEYVWDLMVHSTQPSQNIGKFNLAQKFIQRDVSNIIDFMVHRILPCVAKIMVFTTWLNLMFPILSTQFFNMSTTFYLLYWQGTRCRYSKQLFPKDIYYLSYLMLVLSLYYHSLTQNS